MAAPSPELAFLLLAARAAVDPPAGEQLAAFDMALDAPLLLSLAAVHRLTPLALQSLMALPGVEPSKDHLAARMSGIAVRNLTAVSEMRKALAVLQERAIPAAMDATPGAVLMISGATSYELRASIAIRADDSAAVRETLLGSGYGDATYHGAPVFVSQARPGARILVGTAAPGALERAEDFQIAGGTIRTLTAADLLLAICARASAAGWPRLDEVLAAAMLFRHVHDRQGLVDRARAAALEPALFSAALLARDILCVQTPVAAETERDEAMCRAAAGARQRLLDLGPRASSHALRSPRAGGREIWIAGFPSPYGGADTELDHLIDLLRDHGVDVHLVPMYGAHPMARQSAETRGCQIHEYRDDVFRDKIVVSFCNGEFLAALPAIMTAGRPAYVLWFNCMTWLFDREKEAHARGWIDAFGFQSQYQRHALTPLLEPIGPVRTFPYCPYFNAGSVTWSYRAWQGSYRLGRISRDDAAKFASDTWRIFDRVLVPQHLSKQVYILGLGPNGAGKIGPAPPGLDCQVWGAGGVAAADFYRTIDTMIHKTGGSRENYSRVLLEAYAYGVVPIVEKDYGFPEIVVHGETGFMTSDSDEMSYYASMLARNPREHRRLAENGRRHLEEHLAHPDSCWRGWQEFFDW